MLAIYFAILAFLITVPMKIAIASWELLLSKLGKDDKGENQGTEGGKVPSTERTNDVLNRLGSKANKIKKKGQKSVKRAERIRKAITVLIKVFKALVAFLKALGALLASLGTIGVIILIVVVVVVLVVVASASFFMMQKEEATVTQEKVTVESSNLTTSRQLDSQSFVDNSTWFNCCKTVFEWYFNNVKTYQTTTDNTSTGKRQYYPCELFPGGAGCGDDCSAFVSNVCVYAGFLSINQMNLWGSKAIANPNNATLKQYFNFYTPKDYLDGTYIPKAGDIFAYSGHAEILADPTEVSAYSWGAIATKNPCYRTKDLAVYVDRMWSSNSHKVTAIWQLKDYVTPNSYKEQYGLNESASGE